jgi:hypothetical protein
MNARRRVAGWLALAAMIRALARPRRRFKRSTSCLPMRVFIERAFRRFAH